MKGSPSALGSFIQQAAKARLKTDRTVRFNLNGHPGR